MDERTDAEAIRGKILRAYEWADATDDVGERLRQMTFVVAGAVFVPAYNLELALHTDWGFALTWGAFPALSGYFVEAQTLRVEAVAVAAYAFGLSLAQRALKRRAVTHGYCVRETAAQSLAEQASAGSFF